MVGTCDAGTTVTDDGTNYVCTTDNCNKITSCWNPATGSSTACTTSAAQNGCKVYLNAQNFTKICLINRYFYN